MKDEVQPVPALVSYLHERAYTSAPFWQTSIRKVVNRFYSDNTDRAQKAVADNICDYIQDFEAILNLSTNLWRSRYAAARRAGAVYASRLGNGSLRQDTFDP